MTAENIKHIFFKIMLVLSVISFAIAATILFFPLFEWTMSLFNIPQRVGMSHETIMENYFILLEYLHFPWVNELVMPDFPTSPSGAFHFYEVKQLFYLNYFVLFVSLPCSILYIKRLKTKNQLYLLKRPSFVAAWVPIGLLAFLAVSFDYMFILFHELLFDNDAWLFNPTTDPIINVLTQEFFMFCFIFAFVIIEAFFITGYFIGKRDIKYKQKTGWS